MGGSHHTNPPRRKSGVSSVLQRKTLAQAEFTSAEHLKVLGPPNGPARLGCLEKPAEMDGQTLILN